MWAEEEKYDYFASRPSIEMYTPVNPGERLDRDQEFEFCGDILEVKTVMSQFGHVTLGNVTFLNE